MSMPAQKPGASKQDYETPREFLDAVEARFGPLHVDLAARDDNAKAPKWITPEQDSLSVRWAHRFPRHRAWLNPEFARIDPWAAKCAKEARSEESPMGIYIFMLTPASVGANWFANHVHGKAMVYALSPRLTFVGETQAYPKDCVLSVFGYGVAGFDVWRWK